MRYRKKYDLVFIGLFIGLSFFCFGIYLLIYDKSLLRFWDAYNQHYVAFVKMGQWFRSIIRGQGLLVWDPALGYGADFYLTLAGSNSGSLFDPINWFSALVPTRLAEYGFVLTIFFRLYLCGISFSVLAFRREHKGYAVLCGALAYTFCACAYVGLYQFSFIVPMYVFPLLIAGVDELFEKNHTGLYTVMLTLSALWSYYFTYMISILIIGYCVIKWFCQDREEKTFWKLFILIGRFLLYSLLAAGMAAVVLLPVAKVLMGMGRLDLKRFVPLLYDDKFYQEMAKGLIGTYDMGARDCKIGFCLVAFFSTIGLFFTKKGFKKQLKTEIALMALMLCVPYAGHVMNGFSYVANRWIWAFALAVGLATVTMLSEFRKMNVMRLAGLSISCAAYLWILFVICGAIGSQKYISLGIGLLLLCFLCFYTRRLSEGQYKCLAVALTCLTIMLQAYYHYSDKYSNAYAYNIDTTPAYEQITEKGGLPLLKQINSLDGTRYISDGLSEDYNSGWLYKRSGINFYYSCYDEGIDQFHKSMALKGSSSAHQYMGLDNRSELMALLGVNHFFTNGGYRPSGYNVLEAEGIGYQGEKIQSWKPAKNNSVFTRFDKAALREEYEKYSPFDRQKILMEYCILEKDTDVTKPVILTDESVAYSRENISDKIQIEEDTIIVTEAKAQMDLSFEELDNAEIYMLFDNIHFEKDLEKSYGIWVAGMFNDERVRNMSSGFDGATYINHLYGGKHNWMLNLKLSPEKVNRIRITFNSSGTYTMDGMKLYARKLEEIEKSIAGLNRDVHDVAFPINGMKVSLENKEKEILFAAVPYSEGWKAYDNGEPIEVLKADVGFMALEMEPGEHNIQFAYHTPGLLAGLLISLGSVVGFTVLQVLKKRWIR